jgi:hypothetical protein
MPKITEKGALHQLKPSPFHHRFGGGRFRPANDANTQTEFRLPFTKTTEAALGSVGGVFPENESGWF